MSDTAYMRGRTENERVMIWLSNLYMPNGHPGVHVPGWVLKGEPSPLTYLLNSASNPVEKQGKPTS